MPSNLRAKPIQGHLTDSAGNVIRNSLVTVKIMTPSGAQVVATAKANDDGYFITSPLTSGSYFIYESGILVSQIIHTAAPETIQPFKASVDNYLSVQVKSFNSLLSTNELAKFKMFIQIESDDIETVLYGNSFQIYDVAIDYSGALVPESFSDLYELAKFFQLSSSSRITTTRFDVEYFAPITAVEKAYKRIRWAGVPAIRFKETSKLVIPIDYFSLVPGLPKKVSHNGIVFDNIPGDYVKVVEISETHMVIQATSVDNEYFSEIYSSMAYGDIARIVTHLDTNPLTSRTWYGILSDRPDPNTDLKLYFELLPSSRFVSAEDINTNHLVDTISHFDGMFSGLQSMDSLIPERFTVVENVYAQDGSRELYNYSMQSD